MGWKVLKCSNSTDIFAEYENFLDFYNLTAQVTFEGYYKIKIHLWYKDCYCYYGELDVEGDESIPKSIEEYVKNNYKNIYELPKFIKILDEIGLVHRPLFTIVNITFPFFIDELRLAEINVKPETDDIKKLIRKYQQLLLDDWKTIESSKGIEKYCNNEVSVEANTDPIFPG